MGRFSNTAVVAVRWTVLCSVGSIMTRSVLIAHQSRARYSGLSGVFCRRKWRLRYNVSRLFQSPRYAGP
jgi:hypothetical protein